MNWDSLYLKWLSKTNQLRLEFLKRRMRGHVEIAPNCDIYTGGLFFQGAGKVIFEEGCILERDEMGSHFWVEKEAVIRFGARTWIRNRYQPNVFSLTEGAKVEIGPDSMMSGITISVKKGLKTGKRFLGAFGVKILDSDFHDLDNDHKEESAPIVIGDYVWLTTGVTVLKGVKIGDHCVIGAGSVVSMDIPPYTFAAGVPAKPIRSISDRSKTK